MTNRTISPLRQRMVEDMKVVRAVAASSSPRPRGARSADLRPRRRDAACAGRALNPRPDHRAWRAAVSACVVW